MRDRLHARRRSRIFSCTPPKAPDDMTTTTSPSAASRATAPAMSSKSSSCRASMPSRFRRSMISGTDPRRDTEDDVVWQLYTSGTTGLPKGALLTNRALFAGASSTQYEFPELHQGGRALVAMPLYHIGGCGSQAFYLGPHLVRRFWLLADRADQHQLRLGFHRGHQGRAEVVEQRLDVLLESQAFLV